MCLDNTLRSSIFRNLIIHKELYFFSFSSAYTFNINFLRNIFIKILTNYQKQKYIKLFNTNITNEYSNDIEYVNSVSRSFIYSYIYNKDNKEDIIEFFKRYNNDLTIMELYVYKEILQAFLIKEHILDVYPEDILEYDSLINTIIKYEDMIHLEYIKEDLIILKRYGFTRYCAYILNKENYNPVYKSKEI